MWTGFAGGKNVKDLRNKTTTLGGGGNAFSMEFSVRRDPRFRWTDNRSEHGFREVKKRDQSIGQDEWAIGRRENNTRRKKKEQTPKRMVEVLWFYDDNSTHAHVKNIVWSCT